MKVNLSIVLLAFLFLSCGKDPEPITAFELLTTHHWTTKSFVLQESETDFFHWDCAFNQEIPEFDYEAGDIGRLELEMDLYFRTDSTYLRVQRLNRYIKCKTCSDFVFSETVYDSLGAIFVADESRLYFGSRNDLFQYYFNIEYNSRTEIVIEEFFEVFKVLRDAECEFNGAELEDDGNYPIDLVFKPLN